jgi:hypothetical protein
MVRIVIAKAYSRVPKQEMLCNHAVAWAIAARYGVVRLWKKSGRDRFAAQSKIRRELNHVAEGDDQNDVAVRIHDLDTTIQIHGAPKNVVADYGPGLLKRPPMGTLKSWHFRAFVVGNKADPVV